jgi:LPS-assembly protein
VSVASVWACLFLCAQGAPAHAQPLIPTGLGQRSSDPTGRQMLLQADTVVYDNVRQVVVAEGGVQIFYDGNTVLAERVVYNRQTRRLSAEGNVRITDPRGNVTTATSVDLSEDMRDGFVRGLRLEQPVERTRFAADTAERQPNEVTVFERSTYTACEPCRDNPERPPLWQIRAARIIHKQQEQLIYYEDARLEFFGFPVAYVPYFWSADGTVPRQSGFLTPRFSRNNRVGTGIGVPYYLALSPFYDLTVTPTYYIDQGLHVTADWRQALPNGWYRIRAGGIRQNDPGSVGVGFVDPSNPASWDPGARTWRGGIESWGEFRITERWRFGWNVALDSDQRYFRDYQELAADVRERISTVYLTGNGPRSHFDSRVYYIRSYAFGTPTTDQQAFMPWVAPVTDYATAMADPWVGGEFRLRSNVTHVTRADAMSYRIANLDGSTQRWVTPGFAGDYTRMSIEASWRRSFIDPIGQRWTPFVQVRGDIYTVNPSARFYSTTDVGGPTPGAVGAAMAGSIVPQLFGEENQTAFRGMPAVGFDYRYPFIGAAGDIIHVIEPIAQIIVRPNETQIGLLPNEDAQSLVFDDTNLFSMSRFSGYDRVEGGTRANFGARYTFQTTTGFLASFLFGQSTQLSGLNSFAQGARDTAGVGISSGLAGVRSDYVARVHVRPWQYGDVTARFRFDERDFRLNRMEVVSGVHIGPASLSGTYTFIGAQPSLGTHNDTEHVTIGGAYRLSPNWSLIGAASYSLRNINNTPGWVSNQIGLRYVDDCFVFSLDYQNVYRGFGDVQPQQRIMARISLRTLGDINFSHGIGSTSGRL